MNIFDGKRNCNHYAGECVHTSSCHCWSDTRLHTMDITNYTGQCQMWCSWLRLFRVALPDKWTSTWHIIGYYRTTSLAVCLLPWPFDRNCHNACSLRYSDSSQCAAIQSAGSVGGILLHGPPAAHARFWSDWYSHCLDDIVRHWQESAGDGQLVQYDCLKVHLLEAPKSGDFLQTLLLTHSLT